MKRRMVNPNVMSPDQEMLARFGEALYGRIWAEDMAQALGVAGRSVRYWQTGGHAVPANIWTELREIAAKNREELTTVMRLSTKHQAAITEWQEQNPRKRSA